MFYHHHYYMVTGLINLYEHNKTLKQLNTTQLLYKDTPHSCSIYIEYNMGFAEEKTSSKVSKQVNTSKPHCEATPSFNNVSTYNLLAGHLLFHAPAPVAERGTRGQDEKNRGLEL
jgi:hypothetical protein